MARGYCIGPIICGCNENNYEDCSNYKKMLKQTQKDRESLKARPDFKKGSTQIPSVNDYAKWILSKYDLSDNFLSVRADLWRDYNFVLKELRIRRASDREKRHDVSNDTDDLVDRIPLGFISQDVRAFFIDFINRQK